MRATSYVKQGDLIKVLAHPTRLHILDILSHEEACVCHLTALLKKLQPNVSQHLMVLREAGLVKDHKDGNVVYYRLADERATEAVAKARELLLALDPEVRFPEVPLSPVPGCSCPRCNGDKPCS